MEDKQQSKQQASQPFENYLDLKESIEWFANNVLCPGTEWNKLINGINNVCKSASVCESDHLSIDDLLGEFNRRGFDTTNWDGDEGAEKSIVDGVCNYIEEASPNGNGDGDDVEFLEWCFGQGYVLYADHMPFYDSPILYEKFKQSKQ